MLFELPLEKNFDQMVVKDYYEKVYGRSPPKTHWWLAKENQEPLSSIVPEIPEESFYDKLTLSPSEKNLSPELFEIIEQAKKNIKVPFKEVIKRKAHTESNEVNQKKLFMSPQISKVEFRSVGGKRKRNRKTVTKESQMKSLSPSSSN